MATAVITPDQNAVMAEIFIAAPPARVFEAITDPEQTARWWGQAGVYHITERKVDLRPGGKWLSVGVGADGTPFRVEGEYLEVDPPRLLVHTWIGSYSGSLKTVVRWELEPTDIHGLHPSGPRKAGHTGESTSGGVCGCSCGGGPRRRLEARAGLAARFCGTGRDGDDAAATLSASGWKMNRCEGTKPDNR